MISFSYPVNLVHLVKRQNKIHIEEDQGLSTMKQLIINQSEFVRMCFILSVLFITSFITSHAYAQSQEVINGLNWLKINQNADGSWGELSNLRDTTTVIDTFRLLGDSDGAYLNAVNWIDGISVESNDYNAKRILSMSETGLDLTSDIQQLVSFQNPDGGWGYFPGYESNAYDTATVLYSLQELQYQSNEIISEGINYLISEQNADGSWSFLSGVSGDLATTSMVVVVLGKYEDAVTVTDTVNRGVLWISTKQNPDGGFGSSPSTVHETALALIVLIESGHVQADSLENAVNYLTSNQLLDGSWDEDAYETAIAIRLLEKLKPNLSVVESDLNISNLTPKSGDIVNISTVIRNEGTGSAYNVPVQILVETSTDGIVQLDTTQIIPELPVGGTSTISVDFDTRDREGDYTIHVKIDPDDSIIELLETDNNISVQISIIPLKSDLVVDHANSNISPLFPKAGESVQINMAVKNVGIETASNVPVQILVETTTDGIVQLDTTQIIPELPVGGTSTISVDFDTRGREGDYTIYVKIDPDDIIDELEEANNQVSAQISIIPVPDVVLSSDNITLSKNPVDVGEDVVITAKILNDGNYPATGIDVEFYYDSVSQATLIGASYIPFLAAGDTVLREIPWQANKVGTNVNLYVVVDPQSKIDELTKENNQAVKAIEVVPVSEPNLSVSYRDITFNPTTAKQGGSAEISAIVRNDGFAPADSVEVYFYKGVPGTDGILLHSETIQSISPDSASTVSFIWTNIPDSGEVLLYVEVDPSDTVSEFNENDNIAFEILNIITLPDLTLSSSSIILTPSFPKDGDTVSIDVAVLNSGGQDATNVTVIAYEGNEEISTQVIPLIPGNFQAAVSFTYDTSGKTGAHEITVAVDPDNTIMEQSNDNNTASRFIGVQDANLWLTEQYISPNGDGIQDSTQFFFRLDLQQSVKIIVVNKKGETVRTFSGDGLENITGGNITWKGLNDNGMVVDDGDYQVQIVDLSNNILGGLLVVVDTNRLPLTEAIGTKYLVKNNILEKLPVNAVIEGWTWLPDESAIQFLLGYPYSYYNPPSTEYPSGLYTMAPNGENIVRLVPSEWSVENDPIYDYRYAAYELSPDGEQVAFILNKYNKEESQYELSQLWLVDSYGKNLTLLDSFDITEAYGGISALKWSPDGEYLAYVVFNQDTGFDELWIIEPYGIEKTMIDEEYIDYDSIMWSPDSKRIAYMIQYFIDYNYYNESIRATGRSGNKEDIFRKTGNYIHLQDFEWLNDQKIIVTEIFDYDPGNVIPIWYNVFWLIDTTENGEQIKISDKARYLAVSPDKKRFAFVESRRHSPYIYNSADPLYYYFEYYLDLKVSDDVGNTSIISGLNIFGTSFSAAYWSELDQVIYWSPDSTKLAFVDIGYADSNFCNEAHLVLIDLATNNERVFDVSDDYYRYVCEVRYSNYGDLLWLNDNTSIIAEANYNYLDRYGSSLFTINSENGDKFPLPVETSFTIGYRDGGYYDDSNLAVSPLGRHITYEDLNRNYGRTETYDLLTISSLMNLTADLRVIKDRSGIVLKGTAEDPHFEGYILEYADVNTPDNWNSLAPPSDMPVISGVFTTWFPPYEGTFYVKLTVWDKAGNVAWDRKRISWGIYSSITNLYKTDEVFSPNGDGVKDVVELHYRILEPAHLEFSVYDTADNLIKTFYREYTSAVEDYITWDGRDEYGDVVPDGEYVIQLADYEFFVEVDSTPPDVYAELTDIVFEAKKSPDGKTYYEYTARLMGHAVDSNIKEWIIEYGEGDNPQVWYEYRNGETQRVGKDEFGNPIVDPIKDTSIIEFKGKHISWLGGKRLRITCDDLAGNRSSFVSNMVEERILLNTWDGETIYNDQIYKISEWGVRRVGLVETIKGPIASILLQYDSAEGLQEGSIVVDPDELSITWDNSFLANNNTRQTSILIKATDIFGNEYYSNEVLLKLKCDKSQPDDEDYLQPDNLKIDLEINYNKLQECGVISDKVTISFDQELTPPMLDPCFPLFNKKLEQELKTVIYSMQNSDETWNVLETIDLSEEGVDRSITIDTVSFDEGVYPVKALVQYVEGNLTKETEATGAIIVDRGVPTAQIFYPDKSTMLCPVKFSDAEGNWFGIPIEGIATDNIRVKHYELFYGIGENPTSWEPAVTRSGRQIAGFGSIQGQIGLWDVTNLEDSDFSLKLKVLDVVGNISCYTTTSFSIDKVIEITGLTVDKGLFSPNSDGFFDDLDISYQIDEFATLDARVFNLIKNSNGSYVPDYSAPVKTIVTLLQHYAGDTESVMWDGLDNSGMVVSDGKYGVVVYATDTCGNTRQQWVAAEVDTTPPSVAITYPQPGDPLGNIIQIKGTADDLHFDNAVIETEEKSVPGEWLTISSKNIPLKDDILGQWNAYGLEGIWTLRLRATDIIGNVGEVVVTVDLGERIDLIKDLNAVPGFISPNNDGKRDTADIMYELTDTCDVIIEILDSDDGVRNSYTTTASSAGTYTYTWDGLDDADVLVPDGDYSIKLTAVLSANTSVTQTEAITLSVDTTPPTVDINPPEMNSYISADDITVEGTISDENIKEYTVTNTGDVGTMLLDSATQLRQKYVFGILKDLPEGDYTLNVTAQDLAENTTEADIAFTIDRTTPEVTINTPEEGDYYNTDNPVAIIDSLIEDKNLEFYSVRYSPGESPAQWTELTSGDTLPAESRLFSWQAGNNPDIPDGLYTISLYAKDRAGLEAEARVKVTIDNTPPEVSISSPLEGDYVTKAVDVTGTAFDQSLYSYTLYISEGDCSSAFKWAVINTSYSSVQDGVLTTWQALPPDGGYCLKLSAVDKLGAEAEAMVDVKVDTHPPAAPFISGEVENITGVSLNWTINTEPDFVGYNIYRDGQKINGDLITGSSYLDSGLDKGDYTYTVKAVDNAGSESGPSNEVKLTVDLTGPDAQIRLPQDGSKVSNVVDIKGRAYSPDDFKEYRLYVGYGSEPSSWELIRISPLPLPYGTLTQWDTIGLLDDETYSVKLEAEDITGNITTNQITVIIDNTPPASPVLVSATLFGSDVDLQWQANTETDLAGYLVYRNDQLVNSSEVVVADLKSYMVSGTTYIDGGLPDGVFNFYIVAMDDAGNISEQSNTIEVEIETHPPHTVIVKPENGSTFEKTIMTKAESPDLDIVTVQFEYKMYSYGSSWIPLGEPVTTQPFITYLDPEEIGLTYSDYDLRAVAVDQAGNTDPSPSSIRITYTDLTAPLRPLDLGAQVNGGDVTLTWTANTEPDLNGYNIYRTFGGSRRKVNASVVTDTVYQQGDLSDGTYTYEVTAVDTYGNESDASDTVSVTIYALVIEQPYTPVDESAVEIFGSNAEPDATVEIFVDTGTGPVSAGTTLPDAQGNFIFAATLLPGENRITALATDIDGNISKPSDMVVVVYNEPPGAPVGLAASVEDFNVSLAWDANTEPDILGYNLYRVGKKVNKSMVVESGSVTAPSQFGYWGSNAFDSDPSTYWLSFDRREDGGIFYTAWWELELPSPELISHLEIQWRLRTDYYGNEFLYAGKDYEIQVWSGYAWITQVKISGNTSPVSTFDFTPSYPTDKIRIYITDTTDESSGKQVGISEVIILKDNLITGTSYEDMNLGDGQYSYTVTAVDDYGFESLPSDAVEAGVGDIISPAPPQDLTAVISGADIVLSWAANTEPDLAGYNIYKNSPEGWSLLNTSLVSDAAYIEPDLPNGVYIYRVTAVDKVGNESDPSNEASATIYLEPPQPPINLGVISMPEGNTLSIAWQYSGDPVAGYNLYRSMAPGGPYIKINEEPLLDTSYIDSGLVNGVAYYYVVVAVDSYGNKSDNSNEAMGIPSDTLAPPPPAIFSPTISAIPVVVFAKEVDVSGFAEPGTVVELFRDGISESATDASSEDVFESYPLENNIYSVSISPDGETVAYAYDNSIWLKSLETGVTDRIIEQGSLPMLSPDGSRLAYSVRENNQNRLWIYDLKTGNSVSLTDDTDVDEGYYPSWSSDANKIAFISNRADSTKRNVWIKDFVSDSLTQITDVGYASRAKLSPDGEKLTYFEYGNLYLVDLLSNNSTLVAAGTNNQDLDWSSDSKRLLFMVSRDIHVFEIDSGNNVQITASDKNQYKPVWGPDGQNIVFERWESVGDSALWITSYSADRQERLLNGDFSGLTHISWHNTGGIIYKETNGWNRVYPKGLFNFKNIPLEAGDNSFYAEAVDLSGNSSEPSGNVSVVLDEKMVPDLETTVDDIYIYPPYPIDGEDVMINVFVWNKADVDVENVDVDVYIWDADDNFELVTSETIVNMKAQSVESVTVEWNSAGFVGENSVFVIVDAEDNIPELDETNNYTTRDFYVAATEEISMTTTLDLEAYQVNQDVRINIDLWNPGIERDIALEVFIEDDNGFEVTHFDTISAILPYASEEHYSLVWNSGSTYAGMYRVRTVLKNLPDVIAENSIPFEITPDISILAALVTNRTNYGSNSPVLLSYSVENTGANYILPELQARVIIRDAADNELFTRDNAITNLMPGVSAGFVTSWNTDLNTPGNYNATLEISLNSEIISTKTAAFRIDEVVIITGSLTLTPPLVSIGSTVQAQYTLINSGNTNADDLTTSLLIIDSETETVIDTKETVINLGMSSSGSDQYSFSTSTYDLKTYIVALQCTYQDNTKTLDRATFTVIDTLPPVVTIISPAPGTLFNSEITMTVTATDDVSGVSTVEYKFDQDVWKPMPLSNPAKREYASTMLPSLADEGTRTISFRATDHAGNTSDPVVTTISIDLTPPEPPVITSPPENSPVVTYTVEIQGTAEPGSLVEMMFEGIFRTYADSVTGEFIFTEIELFPGANILSFNATDAAGNISELTEYTILAQEPPVADAGADRNVETGELVTLDGSSSFDPDGDLITYDWSIEWGFEARPLDSLLTDQDIGDRNTSSPNFIPDVDGVYVLRLIVNDSHTDSEPDFVEITSETTNIPPNADAGTDQSAYVGDLVLLDGSASNDPDQGPEPLTYLWTFTAVPDGSVLQDPDIIDAGQAQAAFTPDLPGDYLLDLQVSDGANSNNDTISIIVSVRNVPPNAYAGEDQEVILGDEVMLDGSASDDPDKGPEALSYTWRFVSVGEGSSLTNSEIVAADTVSPSFTPDVAGNYVLELEVFDGEDSDFDNVAITVIGLPSIQDLYARAKDCKVDLLWTCVPEAMTYNIYRSATSGGSYELVAEGHVSDYCAYADLGLTNGITYYYVVSWVDAEGHESPDSNEIAATPSVRMGGMH